MKYVPLTHKLGYILDDVPEHLLSLIVEKGEAAREEAVSMAGSLVGQIKEEWMIPFDDGLIEFVDYLSELAVHYEDNTGVEPAEEGFRKVFPHQSFWINFQRKTEFQPAHSHSGKFSFVIWVKVPYKIENEFALPISKNAKERSTGCFYFLYPEPFSNTISLHGIEADERFEGKIVLFPSSLLHAVYPFYTSDEYRVSIAGNIANPNLLPVASH